MIRRFFIKLKSWEYWPLWVVYFSVVCYWLWLSIRARSLFYFTASNPGMLNGGLAGVSKMKILDSLPQTPEGFLASQQANASEIESRLKQKGLNYPVIAKPEVGERGFGVKVIRSFSDLEQYVQYIHMPFIIQEYIDLPLEAGVFYYRLPKEKSGVISSVVLKKMLKVKGNGKSTVKELIISCNRAFLQLPRLIKEGKVDLDYTPSPGEEIILNKIGNHCLGTTFLNGNHLINREMTNSFDQIAKKIPGFNYGRFDVRCSSETDLIKGRVKILELNGAMSEPAHIYQPGFSFFEGQRIIWNHWSIMFKISLQNHRLGHQYPSFLEGFSEIKRLRDFNRKHKKWKKRSDP